MSSERKSWRPVRALGGLVVILIAVAAVVIGFKYASPQPRAVGLDEIKQSLAAGEVAAARAALLDLYARDPSNADAIEVLADTELQSNNSAAAIMWLKRVPEMAADRAARARLKAAQLAMQLDQERMTEDLASEAIRLDPHFVAPRLLLMRMHFVVLNQRELYEQSELLDRLGELSLQGLAMRCVSHRANWDDDEHVRWLERCLHSDPKNGEIRAALIRYYANGNRRDAALALLDEASDGGPEAWRIRLVRAEGQIEQGQFRDAFDTLAELPDQADSESRAWLARGQVWSALDHPSAALSAFENARMLDPYDPAPTYGAARILMRQGDAEQAEALFARSQQQKDLMRLMGRIMEAANPAYELI